MKKIIINLRDIFIDIFKSIKDLISCLILFRSIRLFLSNQISISFSILKRKKTIFPHPIGIIIGNNVKLGNNCTIYQNVTIGTKEIKNWKYAAYPKIGNNVIICANSVVFGDIEIGDNCIIGAGSIVKTSFKTNSIIAGNPAKLISKKTI
jgi:serine O-acetyltransferase